MTHLLKTRLMNFEVSYNQPPLKLMTDRLHAGMTRLRDTKPLQADWSEFQYTNKSVGNRIVGSQAQKKPVWL